MKFNSLALDHSTRKGISVPLIATLLLSVFSTGTLANRPAMDDESTAVETVNQAEMQTDQNTLQHRPEAEAPSAVEAMMQRQSQQRTYTQQSGDVLQLPAKEMQPGETIKIQLLDYPRRGMSKERVEQEFGQPMAMSEAVGKPPISHWTYNDRIVYFEYSTVLHVVAR
jgi:regulatory protein YycI of two-component signal transduction system YycFG